MGLQAEGGDGDQDEEQRREGNELQEKKSEREKNMSASCRPRNSLISGTTFSTVAYQHATSGLNQFIHSGGGDLTPTSLINLRQFEWTPERGAIY